MVLQADFILAVMNDLSTIQIFGAFVVVTRLALLGEADQ